MIKTNVTREFWNAPAAPDVDLKIVGDPLTPIELAEIFSPLPEDDEAERAREKFDQIHWKG